MKKLALTAAIISILASVADTTYAATNSATVNQNGTGNIGTITQSYAQGNNIDLQQGSGVSANNSQALIEQIANDNTVNASQQGDAQSIDIQQTGVGNIAGATTWKPLSQTGENQQLIIKQQGTYSTVTSEQNGANNQANVSQGINNNASTNNKAAISQVGYGSVDNPNIVTITQDANDNIANATQSGGDRNSASITQSAINNIANSQQQGSNHLIEIKQTGVNNIAGATEWQPLSQTGENNSLTVTQQGTYSTVASEQSGANNEATVSQGVNNYAATSNKASVSQTGAWTNPNIISITQDSSGNEALAAQAVGDNNTLSITQNAAAGYDYANAAQAGANNLLTITQGN